MGGRYNEDTYHLIENNCNHFTEDFIKFCKNEESQQLPDEILYQHRKLKEHPMGEQILQLISGVTENPFKEKDAQEKDATAVPPGRKVEESVHAAPSPNNDDLTSLIS